MWLGTRASNADFLEVSYHVTSPVKIIEQYLKIIYNPFLSYPPPQKIKIAQLLLSMQKFLFNLLQFK
jgi:hypothetical protein